MSGVSWWVSLAACFLLAPKFFSAQLGELMAFIASGSGEDEDQKRQRTLEIRKSTQNAKEGAEAA